MKFEYYKNCHVSIFLPFNKIWKLLLFFLVKPATPFQRKSYIPFLFFLFLIYKIYYTGKYQSLGIKQGGPSAGKWVELPITKSPKIVHFSVGHDGSHALLVAEDGSVFFTGSASKGEDGESSKSLRVALMRVSVIISAALASAACCSVKHAPREGVVYLFHSAVLGNEFLSLWMQDCSENRWLVGFFILLF